MKIVGIIGASECDKALASSAEQIGKEVAKRNLILVTGGLGGVMEAASKGAYEADGIVVGILPTPSTESANSYVTVPIATNMGHARNTIIAHTADILIAIGGGFGTLSEISIAKKLGKKVLGLNSWEIEGVEKKQSIQDLVAEIERIY